ncbi:hypothetical protein BC832DRAFT_453444 [Gaertneriomyces semiglobifer]|nr:hypothetical protein BC832DRAFT_453444 [Gaertneriomyces semiglobifer]
MSPHHRPPPLALPQLSPWRLRLYTRYLDRVHSLRARILYYVFVLALWFSVGCMCLATMNWVTEEKRVLTAVFWTEAFCVALFTLELSLHIFTAPTWRSLLNLSRLLDVMAILNFYVKIVLGLVLHRNIIADAYVTDSVLIRLLDLTRIFRLFKVFPKSASLRVLLSAIVHSLDGLYLLSVLVPLLVILFSTLLYYAEQTTELFNPDDKHWYYDDNELSPFQSVPDCFWIIIVTLTTCGYGDVVPRSLAGRIVMGVVMFVSLFVVAFPLTMITAQYAIVAERYQDRKKQLKLEKKKHKLAASLEYENGLKGGKRGMGHRLRYWKTWFATTVGVRANEEHSGHHKVRNECERDLNSQEESQREDKGLSRDDSTRYLKEKLPRAESECPISSANIAGEQMQAHPDYSATITDPCPHHVDLALHEGSDREATMTIHIKIRDKAHFDRLMESVRKSAFNGETSM